MAKILYLVHRIPYPPNKGDKVRSYHLLKHLAARHQVWLGSFVDDPDDWQHLPRLQPLVADMHLAALHPRQAKLASLRGLLTGEALSLPYYRNAGLSAWIKQVCAREQIDAVVVFSSTMAQYATGLGLPVLVDFVDLDSAKWTEYGAKHGWPLSWLYAREGEKLLGFERAVAAQARHSFFVTPKEVQLFLDAAPEAAGRVDPLCNGVDAEFFCPDPAMASPFPAGTLPLVFTGAMDYWPNVDAVSWFVQSSLPALRARFPALHFYIVGRSPTPAVQALAGEAVTVTGTVDDVRPYLQHAAAVVAPLRLARGIQNKVLEAMAMGKAVVAASSCVGAIDAEAGRELIGATEAEDYVAEVERLLADPARSQAIGQAARQRVLQSYSWDAHLSGLDRFLEQAA
ncbi:TIGR03087 family PEP-CTERM/XrtA system glycosyltransferase [Paucibacter sp. APW11]|uniref:TIGR03087 family PEP-CTERM/XrtA system glycosyltransferase n=1 Tax=Roseateles aquae TaxID=3077235 RepID=A0ABU3P874_9BURK|nr:TIGR03087 family PEP-CTERM/XrtA system glycosyltransferase [Paucibacter sp. APW11]MDT8997946.1 TIGR03087 family PEP-CTERM/XrtA system glycosyltransferase [Paucibacter sp. APW11]